MSVQNVDAIQRFVDRAREDPDAVWDIFHVEWEMGTLAIPDFPPTCRGPDGVREFFPALGEHVRGLGL